MNVFDEIRAELEALESVALFEVAQESYGIDLDETDTVESIVDRCLAIEQKNFFG
jgi:hypothetical protein